MSMKPIQSMAFTAVAAILMMSCEKKVVTQLDTDSNFGKANLKIVYASAYNINYGVQLSVNNVRVSSVVTNTTPFPGGGLNTGGSNMPWYLAVPPGATRISLSVPKSGTNIDSIPLYNGTVSLNFAKFYSAYLTDTLTKTQLVLITEDVSAPAPNTSRFKFVNLMPNVPSLDLYFGANKVASDIQYTSTSPSFILNRADTSRWYVRPAGAAPTSVPIAIYPAITPTFASPQTIPNQRLFTVFARGYNGSTGNRAPNVSLLYN